MFYKLECRTETKWPITPTAITIILLSSDSNQKYSSPWWRQTLTRSPTHRVRFSLSTPQSELVKYNQINLHSRKVINQTHQIQIDRSTKKEPLKPPLHRPWMHFCSCCTVYPPRHTPVLDSQIERENMECGNLIIASYFIIATRVLSCLHIGRSLSLPPQGSSPYLPENVCAHLELNIAPQSYVRDAANSLPLNH